MAETTVKQRAFAFISCSISKIGLSRFDYVGAISSAVTTCLGFHLTDCSDELALLHLRLFPRPFSDMPFLVEIGLSYPILSRAVSWLFSMFSGEFCLRLKLYLVVRIASDVLTEHYCQVCILAMMFCRSDCRLCAGKPLIRNQEFFIYSHFTLTETHRC